MPTTETTPGSASARALTLAAYVAFVPIGVVTVLLGPLLPALSNRWSLDYAQAGTLFPTQFWASTAGVLVSGMLIARYGFRFAMKAGLVLISVSVALLLAGARWLGMISIAGYGAGLGLAVPAANLLVAEVNPGRRSAALNTLNFCWSVGAVACPFLVAAASRTRRISLFLTLTAGASLLVAMAIAATASKIVEPVSGAAKGGKIPWRHPSLFVLGALFFVYVGTENGFGGWVASYAKSLGSLTAAMSVMTPSFFYASLTLGRLAAPLLLRRFDEIRLTQAGLVIACAGMAALLWADSLTEVAASASLAGLGLSIVYPITIALVPREFGPAATPVGSVLFTLANLGGGSVPWLVGISSTRFGSLKAGLAVPVIGGAAMFALYLRKWNEGRA